MAASATAKIPPATIIFFTNINIKIATNNAKTENPIKDANAVSGTILAMDDIRKITMLTANETTTAIIWLSVMEEINIPIAINTQPSNQNAKIVV